MDKIRNHKDLQVYQLAFQAALEIYQIQNRFLRKKNIHYSPEKWSH